VIHGTAPDFPVFGGTDWDLVLCDRPINMSNPYLEGMCMMDFDATMRQLPEEMLQCGGNASQPPLLVVRGDGTPLHGWGSAAARAAVASAHNRWNASGMSGVIWDGIQGPSAGWPSGPGSGMCDGDGLPGSRWPEQLRSANSAPVRSKW
jgi:hypothetical protein